jgi:hypothetical protein
MLPKWTASARRLTRPAGLLAQRDLELVFSAILTKVSLAEPTSSDTEPDDASLRATLARMLS